MEKIFINKTLYYEVYKLGKRTIYAPCDKLKKIQREILAVIKNFYTLKLNISDTAKVHVNQKWLLKMDIKSFYESVSKESILVGIDKIFENLDKPFKYDKNQIYQLCTLNDKLPTGAVTSAYFANMALNKFDSAIYVYCKMNNVNFSRYMDDLFFSGSDKEALNKIEYIVTAELKENNFHINPQKTKYISNNRRQEILGLVVNNDKAKIRNDVKREYRAIFYNYLKAVYLESKFGINSLLLKRFSLENINGYLSYIKCCDKELYKSMLIYIKKLLKHYKLEGNKEIKFLKKIIGIKKGK